MKAIIIGAGKIGFNLAKLLSKENHDVIVVEKDPERARILQENLDIQVVVGNGASTSTLEEAGAQGANLMVAVTEIDEVNMIACLLAKNNFNVEKTVARVRSHEYAEEYSWKKGAFSGIDLVINPDLVTAKEIAKLIDVPEALDVVYYAEGKVQLLELKIAPGAPAANKCLNELKPLHPFLIVGILRQEKMIIPRGSDMLLENDIIFILAKTKEMVRVERFLGTHRIRSERVMILGGGYAGYQLARILEDRKYSVKIVEKDYKRCVDLSDRLNNVLVLHGDATDLDLLKSEGAGECDVFVCLTDDDKLNLLVSLIAKHLGAKRAIAQVRRSDYIDLMESVGIDVGISPRTLTANAILRYIQRGNNVISVTLLSQEGAEMLEIIVAPNSRVANKKIKDINFPSGALLGSIYRKDLVSIATGEEVLRPGDIVTVFSLPYATAKVMEYFSGN